MSDAVWIIATGSLIAISCALAGNYLVLRKQAMMGDALSHAILPGLVIAYLFSGSSNITSYIIACSAIGVVSVALIDLFKSNALISNDVAIGLSFTSLFALGVILISTYAGEVHLDYDHVLYGEIAFVPLDTLEFSGMSIGPRSFWIALIMLLIVILFIAFAFRIMNISSFNPDFAQLLGINTRLWHYLFLSLVSLIVVVSFESVGAILVISFLVIPSSTAFLLSQSIRRMLLLSVLFAIASTVVGYYLAYWLNSSIAASMASISGTLFCISFIFKLYKRSY